MPDHLRKFPGFIRRYPLVTMIAETLCIIIVAGMLVSLLLSLVPQYREDEASMGTWNRFSLNMQSFFSGRLADSNVNGFPLPVLLRDRVIKSLSLITGALGITIFIGAGIGVLSGLYRHNRWLRWTANLLQNMSSMPMLVWAVMLIAFFQYGFQRLILYSFRTDYGPVWNVIIILCPMICLSFGDGMLAEIIRSMRDETLKLMEQPFVRNLKSHGLPVHKHIFRGLLGQVGSILASRVSYLIGGSVVVEWVFNYQGLGFEILSSITAPGDKNDAFILAATMTFVIISVILYLLSELVLLMSDPRIKAN